MTIALGIIVPALLTAILVSFKLHVPARLQCIDCGSAVPAGFLSNPYRMTCEVCGRVQPRPRFKAPLR